MYLLGRAIRQHRRALGLTQQKLARRVGIAQSKLQRIEQGQAKTVSPQLIRKISHELDVDANILLGVEPRPSPLLAKLEALPPQAKSQIKQLLDEISAFLSKK